jgi:hypothetical protein
MKILGIEGLNEEQLATEIQRGAKFVIYQYCISIVILTFRRPSDIYFIRAGETAVGKGLGFSLISLLLGWWGIPWGPIYTIGSFITNFGGGKDVTQEVLVSLQQGAY